MQHATRDSSFRNRASAPWLHAAPLALAVAAALSAPAKAQPIPTNAQNPPNLACTVTQATFNSWFVTQPVTLNGAVKPANSVAFPNVANCSFYQWSMQMFLWLTSPAPVSYGSSGRVFDTSTFYDVSPADANGNRVFIPHTPGSTRVLSLRAAQPGPDGLPVIFSKTGKLLEVAEPRTGPTGKPLIRNSAGRMVEVQSATIGANGQPIFRDAAGHPIQNRITPTARQLTQAQSSAPTIVQRFVINGTPVFIDPFGNVIDTEQGQAGGGGVLQAQKGSLVYYVSMTNDVYAYFRTSLGSTIPSSTQFPTTQAQLAKVVAFAKAHGTTFPDPDALAIELKSSWVDASTLPDPQNYITMSATIPTYNETSNTEWTPSGQKTITLAMVGLHVVGSAAGHPELLWATFEHFGNSPNAVFTYNTASGVQTVPQSTAGTWLFAANGASEPPTFNLPNMKYVSPNIVAIAPNTISPSNALRAKVWGAASNVSPNPVDGSTTNSNTEIIMINNGVRGMMPAGDVRNNYFMMGATWTIGGAAPTTTNQVGTSQLANSTMETFQQGPDNTTTNGTSNCFDCHTTNLTTVSHVFKALKPLF
jgi:hypothetical protein